MRVLLDKLDTGMKFSSNVLIQEKKMKVTVQTGKKISQEFKSGDILRHKPSNKLYLYGKYDSVELLMNLTDPSGKMGQVYPMDGNWQGWYELFNGKVTISNDFVENIEEI